ncbi:MAG: hypothetical protein ABI743_10750 [bacterium]
MPRGYHTFIARVLDKTPLPPQPAAPIVAGADQPNVVAFRDDDPPQGPAPRVKRKLKAPSAV